jgi:acetyl esterase/lipase
MTSSRTTALIPFCVSAEAAALFADGLPTPEAAFETLQDKRRVCERIQREIGARQAEAFDVRWEDSEVAGVPVRIFMRRGSPTSGSMLLNLHGGGFMKDSGSLTENIPIVGLTGIPVVSVLYRLAPEHRFPAAVEDAEAVYRALMTEFGPSRIALYGTSAGAVLSAQTLARLRSRAVPLPKALGFFSGTADLSRPGDSEHFFPLIDDPRPVAEVISPYLQDATLDDPAVSPLLGDLRGWPTTLCITGTRDLMMSQTCLLHRALLRASVDARLVVFEAMPHAHWSYLELPESDEAFKLMARFFIEQLASAS